MYRDITITEKGMFSTKFDYAVADDIKAYRIVYKLSESIIGNIQVTAHRPDGEKIYDTAPIDGHTAHFVLPQQMYSIVGQTILRVSVVTEDMRVITTKQIQLDVIEPNGEADIAGDDRVPALTTLIAQATAILNELNNADGLLNQHVENKNNPHEVTKDQIGLNNVDNTSDLDKPISTATQTELDDKVDKEPNKSLVSDSEISKLSGIQTGATKNDTDANLKNRANHTGTQAISTVTNLQATLDNKVDKVAGEGLTPEKFTTAEKSKLSAIAAGAQVNTIESIKVDGSTLPITSKSVNVDLSGKLDVNDYVDPEKIANTGVDSGGIVLININQSDRVYKSKAGSDFHALEFFTGNADFKGINYRFEMILEVEDDQGWGSAPSFSVAFFKDEYSSADKTTWLIPPAIEHPHTINKFVFETFDGGVTWYANQCYSVEVT